MSDDSVSRREFVRKAAVFTGAGLAVGGAVALGKGLWDSIQGGPAPDQNLQAQAAEATAREGQLQQALAAAEAELNRLRPDYAGVLSVNAQLQNTLSSQQQEIGSAKAALTAAQARADKLAQLLALYDKLDNTGFDALVKDGLAASAASFTGALGLLPLVSEGVKLAAGLLDGFEIQIPNYRAGLSWLQKRMDDMNASIASVEKAILQALKSLDPLTSTMTQLVTYILTWLPANIGAGVKLALDAVDLLYASLPPVITGAHDQVIEMLTAPFADDAQGLKHTLVQPIREKSLNPSAGLAGQVQSLSDTYIRSLHVPAQIALDQRAAVLKEIADFRAANQV